MWRDFPGLIMVGAVSLKAHTDSKNFSFCTLFQRLVTETDRGCNLVRERRTRLDIYADILREIDPNSRKMHIVYGASLGFKQGERYLDELLENGLIKIKSNSPLSWSITELGRKFLEKYGEIREILPRQVKEDRR